MATTTAPTQTNRLRPQQQPSGGAPAGAPSAGEADRWVSLLAGGALALFGLAKGSVGGLGLALLGGALAYRGAAGRPGVLSALGVRPEGAAGVQVEETVTMQRSPEDLYRYWRNFENLPRFMFYLDSVRTTGGNRSHWVARGPLDFRVEWDAEVTEDRPNERIAWRSLPGSAVETEGSVQFATAPGNRGTRVKVVMRYNPPAGKVGDLVARLFGRSGEQEAREDLRRFKRLLETGEIPTTRGQPSGRGRDPYEQTAVMIVQNRLATGVGWFSIGLGLAEVVVPGGVARLIGVRDHDALFRVIGAREIASGIGILAEQRPVGWLWGRVAGDAMDLGLLGAALLSPGPGWARTALATLLVTGLGALDLAASLQLSNTPDFGAAALPDGRARDGRAGRTAAAR